MDSACKGEDQRKSRSARISGALKQTLQVADQLLFPRKCSHCKGLLSSSKERLCKPCLELLDPRSAAIGCTACLKPLRELGDEYGHEECSCKENHFFHGVIYLEPLGGVLSSLIRSKALLEERGVLKALCAYLVQIALESKMSLPEAIITLSPLKEERLMKRELEKMLELRTSAWDLYARYPLLREIAKPKLKSLCNNQILWLIGLKADVVHVKFWKETLRELKPSEVVLIIVSCN